MPPAFTCPTLYVVGGMYGNPYALDAVVARASIERSPPEIVFNGDFHYLDVDPDVSGRSRTACGPRYPRVSQFRGAALVRGARGHAGDEWFVDLGA